ncbi:hypothetical protein VPH35_106674 [Triticum aestivum]
MPWLDLNGGSRLKSNSEDTQPKIEIFLPEPKGSTICDVLLVDHLLLWHVKGQCWCQDHCDHKQSQVAAAPLSTKEAFVGYSMHKTALLCVVSFKLTLQHKMKCIFVISRSLRDAACRSSIATWTCARNARKIDPYMAVQYRGQEHKGGTARGQCFHSSLVFLFCYSSMFKVIEMYTLVCTVQFHRKFLAIGTIMTIISYASTQLKSLFG